MRVDGLEALSCDMRAGAAARLRTPEVRHDFWHPLFNVACDSRSGLSKIPIGTTYAIYNRQYASRTVRTLCKILQEPLS